MKRLVTLLTACALLVAPAVPAAAATQSATFDVQATVSALATLTFGLNGSAYNFGSVTDNTNSSLAAGNNSSGTIDANVRSTTTGGSASIYINAPNASIAGSTGGSLPITNLQYQCTGSYTVNNSDGTSSSGVTTGITAGKPALAQGTGNTCVTFTNGASIKSAQLLLGLFLDDRFLAADSYSGGGFSLTVSAT